MAGSRHLRGCSARGAVVSLSAMVSVLGLAAPAQAAGTLYFADIFVPDFSAGSIRMVNTDGTGLQTLVTTGGGLRGIDVDPAAGLLYWTDVNSQTIYRSNLDGTGQTALVPGVTWASDVAAYAAGDALYWGDQVDAILQRSDLDGSGVSTLRSTPFHTGLGIDEANGKLYWSTATSFYDGSIYRTNLDGTGLETVVTGESKPSRIAIDVAGGKVYWTDYVLDVVRRANLDGSNVEDLFTVGANYNPRGITLDLEAGKVYWGQDIDFDGTGGQIWRMDLDGANPELFLDNVGLVNDLVFVPEPGTLMLALIGLVAMRRTRRSA